MVSSSSAVAVAAVDVAIFAAFPARPGGAGRREPAIRARDQPQPEQWSLGPSKTRRRSTRVHPALAYCHANREEIEASLAEDHREITARERGHPPNVVGSLHETGDDDHPL